MFKNAIKAAKKLESGTQYSMSILPDEDGYYDKECPDSKCQFKFKVLGEDWSNIFSDDRVHCPFCGHIAPATSWYTTEQIEQCRNQAREYVMNNLRIALEKDAKLFNQHHNTGFIRMSMKTSWGPSFNVNLPAKALDEMQQKITCSKCGAHYAVLGSAFYCPCCGFNSAELTFRNTIKKVGGKIKSFDLMRDIISESNDKDDLERVRISLIESSITDLVVALQRLAECIYPKIPNAKPLPKNVFQRLNDSNKLWKELIGSDYTTWLSAEEYNLLIKCFQQRHVFQHNDGIIDQDYIDKSGDLMYSVGQHLVIKKEDIDIYVKIITKIGDNILPLI